MMKRICLDDECPDSRKSTPCLRNQMYYHILKKQTSKMIEIVTKYHLVKFPNVLKRYTLANLICDFTVESVAEKIMNGDQ